MSKRNRNRDEVFKAIFEKLVDAVSPPEFGDVVASSQLDDNKLKRKRFIKLDKDERNWLTHTEVIGEPYFISPRVQALTLRFKGTNYFSMIGLEPNGINLHKDLPLTKPNAGLVAVLLAEGRVPLRPKINVLEVINSILSQYEGTDEYKGHDIDDVKKHFLPLEVYEITQNFVLTVEQLPRLVGLRLCRQKTTLSLPFSDDTLDFLRELFLLGSSEIPYENLVQCCYSVSWQHAFLETYRCVERLYSVHVLNELYSELFPSGGSLSLIEFSKQIEDTLGWYAKEEDSSIKLINASTQNAKDLLEKVKKTTNSPPTMEIGKWFYQIRNNIVHFRPANEKINLTDPQWDELIRGTLGVIEFWYKEYESKLQ